MTEWARSYEGYLQGEGLRFGIVVSRFNEFIGGKLLTGALDSLDRHGVAPADIDVAWVPGAMEIPLAAKRMAQAGKYDGIVLPGGGDPRLHAALRLRGGRGDERCGERAAGNRRAHVSSGC